ncbi:hypothetical protein [Streptomyces sp. NPDC101249]|uniref:hypothetical protein n=1 Tax=Streptomyces sp. NPDC101249 TaxID=3366140 RepID=UPI00380E3298
MTGRDPETPGAGMSGAAPPENGAQDSAGSYDAGSATAPAADPASAPPTGQDAPAAEEPDAAPAAGTRPGAPDSAPEPSFDEFNDAIRHSLLKSRRGAVNVGRSGSAVYIESMYGSEGRPPAKLQVVPFGEDIVTAIHVPVPGQAEMLDRLRQRHALALDGEEGTGRGATAVRLLTECSRPRYAVNALYREEADVVQGVCEQADEVLREGHGYLVEAGGRPVPAQTLERLGRLAEQAGAYVVVTGLPSSFPGRGDRGHVLTHHAPDAAEVLEAHLSALLTRHRSRCLRDGEGDAARCDARSTHAFLNRVTADDQLKNALGLARSVGEVVRLANILAENVHTEDLSDVIGHWRDWLRLLAREMLGLDARQGDLDVPGPHHQAYRISYAFFDGHPLSDVVEAGDLLSRTMLPLFGIPEEDLDHHMAEQNIDRLVPPEMRAQVTTATDARAHPRRAALAHAQLLPNLLESTWDAYGRLRLPLLAWLDRLVGPGRERVRVRVAQLAGLLMGHEFDFVYRELVRPWARSPSRVRRQCAALALEMAAADEPAADRVASRVQDWAHSPGAALQDSAALAYGTSIGLRDVSVALTELERLGRKPELAGSSSISFSTALLFMCGRADEVMAALGRWVTSPEDHLPRHAVRTMLELGRATLDIDRPGRPALAELALDNAKNSELLVALWSRALVTKETSARAWHLTGRWLPAADGDENEDLAALYASLARRVFADPLRNRALFHLEHVWLPRHEGSTTITRVLDALRTDGYDEGNRR